MDPNWIIAVLGGGGVIAIIPPVYKAIEKFLARKYVAPLEREKHELIEENVRIERERQRLAEDNIRLQNELTLSDKKRDEALSEINDFYQLLEELREADIPPKNAATLRRLLRNSKRLESLSAEAKDYEIAAKWLKYCQAEWANEATKVAQSKHSLLFSNEIRENFCKDIIRCLEWAYISLSQYQHTHAPLSRFIGKPYVNSYFPYMDAIAHIKKHRDKSSLEMEQSLILDRYLVALIEKIKDEFS